LKWSLVLLLLCACKSEPDLVSMCDEAVKAKIKTPSTYSRIGFTTTDYLGFSYVRVEFDAQNEFGAVIRSKAICKYDKENLVQVILGE
jgi:hypothetical protein